MRNVGTLLWRTVYIQAVCRHYVATLIEVVVVLLLFYLSTLSSTPVKLNAQLDIQTSTALEPPRPDALIYGPSTPYYKTLMEAVADELSSKEKAKPASFWDMLEIESKKFNANATKEEPADLPLVVKSIESADMVRSSCEDVIASNASLVEALCVALYSNDNEGAANASLRFTVYMPTSVIGSETKEFPLGSFSESTKVELAIKYQHLIEKTHVQMQHKMIQENAIYQIRVNMLSGWIFGANKDTYMKNLSWAIYLWSFILLVRRMNAIESEFSSGLAEHQAVMGMSAVHFMLGHFLNIMVYEVVESCMFVLLMYPATGYATGVDVTLMVFSFFVYGISHAIFIIIISWVFPTGWFGIIAGIVGTFFGPGFIGILGLTPVPQYILAPRKSKLLSGLLPHTSLYSVLRILFMARDIKEPAGWSLVNARLAGLDNVTILEIWGVTLLAVAVMLFLAWYLPKVLPWASNIPQSPIFCLKTSYWTSSKRAEVTPSAPVLTDPARFEQGPPGVEPIVEVNNVTKVYDGVPALDGLSVKLYQSRVTVLLGHNGAGKTTLFNILTGVTGATSGTARVFGYDASTQRDEVRTVVSYCQQTDIFFGDLTCVENLLYFGSLKGTAWAALQGTIADTLKVVHLEDKAYSMPDTLSGGMKRRLSLAIAIVSKPKLVILDEPTTGLDAETRRNVWDVIQAMSKERSVLLSSHDMEEADAIGDSIIIMARGKAVCSGSTAFLKKACGVGYKVTLVKVPGRFNLQDVLALIRKTLPGATEVHDDKAGDATIALNTLDHQNFPAMFKTLEHHMAQLGIQAIGVIAASMKDVYLKINLDWTPGGKNRETAVDEKVIDSLCQGIVRNPTACRRFWALFLKRLLYVTRSWTFLFVGILIPLALQLYIASSIEMPSANQWSGSGSLVKNGTFPIEVRLGVHFPDSQVFLQDSTTTNASRTFRVLAESEGSSVLVVEDLEKALEELATKDFGYYMRTHPMAAAFERNLTLGLVNPTSLMSLPVTLNMLHTAQLRQLTGKPTVRISATLTYMKVDNVVLRAVEVIVSFFQLFFYWSFYPALSYTLAFSAFAAFPVAERLGRAREVQLMTGVSGWLFVLAHLVFDYLCYLLIMVPWCLIHYWFNEYSTTMAGAIMVTFAFFGPSIIMLCYLMAERALTTEGAMTSVILWFFAGGFILQVVVAFVSGFLPVEPIFSLFPPYGILKCILKTNNWQSYVDLCSSGNTAGFDCTLHYSVYGFTNQGIGIALVAAAVEDVLLYVLMSLVLSGYCTRGPDVIPGSQELEVDDDVEEEMKLVNRLRDSKQFGDYALVAWKLQKRFGDLHAVRGLYLALRRGECFGLLGVNGAGKTTTFEILAGLTNVTFGEAYTQNATLSGNRQKWQSQISYCFQSGGLLDKLTGYEYLYLIGRLRGIPESDLKGVVDSVISVADLTLHADKPSGVYSGGNQRKLAISAALIGLPPIVFLDEPYAGVDVVSRTKIFQAVGRVKERMNTAFVLSSHNIDECEISCDRLTIMVEGQMMCLGTVQHIRDKYGKGYRLHFMLKHDATSDAAAEALRFASAVPSQFPGIKLTDQHENVFSYHLVERIPWSVLFTKVRSLEEDFALEYAMVGDNTIEQIFIAFAKLRAAEGLPHS